MSEENLADNQPSPRFKFGLEQLRSDKNTVAMLSSQLSARQATIENDISNLVGLVSSGEETSGSKIKDFAIMKTQSLDEGLIKPYETFYSQIQNHDGEPLLLVRPHKNIRQTNGIDNHRHLHDMYFGMIDCSINSFPSKNDFLIPFDSKQVVASMGVREEFIRGLVDNNNESATFTRYQQPVSLLNAANCFLTDESISGIPVAFPFDAQNPLPVYAYFGPEEPFTHFDEVFHSLLHSGLSMIDNSYSLPKPI
jgi:hypothetical protein